MSLMARLRRIEAGIEWLETEGVLRFCKTQIKLRRMKEQIEARLAREPGHEEARFVAPYLGVKLPPLPKPVVYSPPPPPSPSPAPAQPHPEEPREARRLEGCEPAPRPIATKARGLPRADREPQGEVVRAPPPETHDIPEHMQIRPVTWRQRGPQDDDDWEDSGPDYGQCLTEYDPLADEDS